MPLTQEQLQEKRESKERLRLAGEQAKRDRLNKLLDDKILFNHSKRKQKLAIAERVQNRIEAAAELQLLRNEIMQESKSTIRAMRAEYKVIASERISAAKALNKLDLAELNNRLRRVRRQTQKRLRDAGKTKPAT